MSVEILFDDEKIATSLAAPRNDADMKTVATLSGRNRCLIFQGKFIYQYLLS